MTNNEEDYKADKTIDELAREAMKAIKDSGKKSAEQEQEELEAKNRKLKAEVEARLRKKFKRIRDRQEKEDEREARIKEHIDSKFMVEWENPDEKGLRYTGKYNDAETFKIVRGLTIYSLYILDENINVESWRKSSHVSTDLFTLKKKADDILKESIKKSEEIKKKEDDSDTTP